MVKFSAEDGKEDSRKRRCLSSSCDHSDSGEEDADARNDSLEKEDLSGGRNVNSNGGKESATVIMDLDILECPICYEIMNPPIFQCQNGHIVCSVCCGKMSKCHSCSLPLGPARCLALERVMESIKLPCPNSFMGCNEFLSNSERESHSSKCSKIPCHCPLPTCSFAGPIALLSLHLSHEHHPLVVDSCLAYDQPLTVSLKGGGAPPTFLVFIATDGTAFFLLFNSLGLFMVCIGPDYLAGQFSYRLKVSCRGSSVLFESGVPVLQCLDDAFSPDFFLFIPPGFVCDQGQIMLDVCILSIKSDE